MTARRTAWLSKGFEVLIHRLKNQPPRVDCDFDVVIVGSGYGGAVAAAELAGCTNAANGNRRVSVCVLERGKEYLAGMFPTRLGDLPGHIRVTAPGTGRPRGRREGLFDFRIGEDVSALVANGLGGGSLINAGVMDLPAQRMLAGWPAQIWPDLEAKYFAIAKRRLGAADAKGDNTIARHDEQARKHAALKALAKNAGPEGHFRDAAVTIAMQPGYNDASVERNPCRFCGDCATGCNRDAKDSLDVNLLAVASLRDAEIFTGATVLSLSREQGTDAWILQVAHTDDKLRERQGGPLRLRARKVILAAGTFGSTEILLRSRSSALQFSRHLGQRFSANGDSIAAVYGQSGAVNNSRDEAEPCLQTGVGPTITGVVDLREQADDCLIEDLAIPAAIRRVFEEVVTTSNLLHELGSADESRHVADGKDPCAVDSEALMNTAVVAMMGDDGAKGMLELAGEQDASAGDGAIRVRWPELRDAPVFERQARALERLRKANQPGARVIPNPLWQLVPEHMKFLFDNPRGPAFTVHPLGGCSIGTRVGDGVVNEFGQVFKAAADAASSAVWPNLVVLDGSIVRSALGTNPALTITALALRAVEALRREWKFDPPPQTKPTQRSRPVFRERQRPLAARPTLVEVVERLSGPVAIKEKGGATRLCIVELTLHFERTALGGLVLPPRRERQEPHVPVALKRALTVWDGKLRIFDFDQWTQVRLADGKEEDFDEILLMQAPVAGTLYLMHREPTNKCGRGVRAFLAYVLNRGMRDYTQWRTEQAARKDAGGWLCSVLGEGRRRLCGALKLATHAGEVRLLEYDLTIGKDVWVSEKAPLAAGDYARQKIAGRKRLTYARKCNPWRQLMEMELQKFPGLADGQQAERKAAVEAKLAPEHNDVAERKTAVLVLDPRFLAAQRVPLLHIVDQQDVPCGLADLASFVGYFGRLLLKIHLWSFRRPDTPTPRELQRLPGRVPGLPEPEIHHVEFHDLAARLPIRVRLTRYRPKNAKKPPVVLIHGYSASGTTFAHHAVRPNLAEHLCNRQHDVWIVDLRTSSGMPTARHPWTFEDAALADLPAAIGKICELAGSPQVDIFAHCMGAAMFSMAMLAPARASGSPLFRHRTQFHHLIRRAVLSQIGPVVVMSPANIFRGYVMSYVRHFLPLADYDFRVPQNPGFAEQLMDRLLASLPYPEREFRVENPLWPWARTPFVGTRHRMDALYGRDFSLADKNGSRLAPEVLEYIDDLFGPLSIETVSQAIHFAQQRMITDPAGNGYPSRQKLIDRWTFPTLSLHGSDNGLADVATLGRLGWILRHDAGLNIVTEDVEGFGHQDCLIGKDAEVVFQKVSKFLS